MILSWVAVAVVAAMIHKELMKLKIIHCADLHLESPMRRLPPDKAKERRAELLDTFRRMVAYAAENDVSAIIIAGDLFDTKKVSAAARSLVRDAIESHPDISFYYLRGNHDAESFLAGLEVVPPNLRLFSDDWTSYEEGGVVISGAEMIGGHSRLCSSLRLDPDKINIVVLHGQLIEAAPSSAEDIDLRSLRNMNIDYLALGHIHAYRDGRLDGRGRWCYPGCLEGRGFDECGEHGFVLLNVDTETRRVESSFVPFMRRCFLTISADLTGLRGADEVDAAVHGAVAAAGSGNLIKLVLTGEADVECEKDPVRLEKSLKDSFYFVEVVDETRFRIDYDSYELDLSLKGEFVRTVKARTDLSDEDKAAIIRCGFMALAGEEDLL